MRGTYKKMTKVNAPSQFRRDRSTIMRCLTFLAGCSQERVKLRRFGHSALDRDLDRKETRALTFLPKEDEMAPASLKNSKTLQLFF